MKRDPPDPKAARATAKELFRALEKIPPRLADVAQGSTSWSARVEDNPAYFEHAAVLADALMYTDRPEVGEALALLVAGRASPLSRRFGHLPVGTPIPEGTRATELANAVLDAQNRMFPPRRRPCMPNAKELRQLVVNEHGTGPEGRQQLRTLTARLRAMCGYSSFSLHSLEVTMEIANVAIGGHGAERAAYEFGGDRVADFYYVNMGDAYNATLMGSVDRNRYWISTWGDEVERVERRFGEDGMWRV